MTDRQNPAPRPTRLANRLMTLRQRLAPVRSKSRGGMVLAILVAAVLWFPLHGRNGATAGQETAVDGPGAALGLPLTPTVHPPVPATLEGMLYAPTVRLDRAVDPVLASFAWGVRLLEEANDAAAALPLVSAPALLKTDVADYARYYTGVAQLQLNRLAEAEATLATLAARDIAGQLPYAAAVQQAAALERRGRHREAIAIYERLLEEPIPSPQAVWLKLGLAAETAGDRTRAIEAQRRIAHHFPLSAEAGEAEQALTRLNALALSTPDLLADELTRAEVLFNARRTALARPAYERLRSQAQSVHRDLATLRLAALDAQAGRHAAAVKVFHTYAAHPALAEEARFHQLGSTRELGRHAEYRALARAFADDYPDSPRAEEALNDLGTHYIRTDHDAEAARLFAEMVARFPAGRFTERAAWRAGWWAYRQRNYRETIRYFEHGAAGYPRSDYRPTWLYWSARAYDALGERPAATERYRLVATDYLNSYYGRLAWTHLEARQAAHATPGVRRELAPVPPPPPTAHRVARLIELGLYAPALAELQYAQQVWGDSAQLQATMAWVRHHQALGLTALERFNALRGSITIMRRAYPQFMAAGGEELPTDVLRIIFPLDYWPLIQKYSQQHGLDAYLMAALMAQESTFTAEIRSHANAIGLMQVIPATGARIARQIGLRPFSADRLTNPEVNVRIGMQYFADLVKRFNGGTHFALASYNAGEHRVDRWRRERPGLPQDEFIDDIPFPETQNYVKRILGTAEDYRRLYGSGAASPVLSRPDPLPRATTTAAAPAKKAPAKKAPAKKAPAKKAPAKKK